VRTEERTTEQELKQRGREGFRVRLGLSLEAEKKVFYSLILPSRVSSESVLTRT
jgi:hypothetical protein